MRHWKVLLGFSVLLWTAGVASAQPTITITIFETVDSVEDFAGGGPEITIVGVLQGDSQPTTVKVNSGSAHPTSCKQMALMVLSKPGKYLLRITNYGYYADVYCALLRNAP